MAKLKFVIISEKKGMLITEIKICQLLDFREWIHSMDGESLRATEEETKDAFRKHRNSQQSME